jgi:hypothetical protein
VKGVAAWQFPSFQHPLLAYRAILWLVLRVLNEREVDINVPELGAEHVEFPDLMVQVQDHAIAMLKHVELGKREEVQVKSSSGAHQHQHVHNVQGLLRDHEDMVQIELLDHSLVVILVVIVVVHFLMKRERVLQLEGEVVD